MRWHTISWGNISLNLLTPYWDELERRWVVHYYTQNKDGDILVNETDQFNSELQAVIFFNNYAQDGKYYEALNKARRAD